MQLSSILVCPPHISDLAEIREVDVMVVAGSVVGVTIETGSLFEGIQMSLEMFSCVEETSSLKAKLVAGLNC